MAATHGEQQVERGWLLSWLDGLSGLTLAAILFLSASVGVALRAQDSPVKKEGSPIRLNAGTISPVPARQSPSRLTSGSFEGRRLHLIQFGGPVRPEWFAALQCTGARILDYIPENTYLVYGDDKALRAVAELAGSHAFVRWHGPYLDAYKVDPAVKAGETMAASGGSPPDLFAIQLVFDPAANGNTLNYLDQIKLAPIMAKFQVLKYVDIVVRIPPALVSVLAGFGDIISIRPYTVPTMQDERQDQILAGNVSVTPGPPPTTVPAGPGYLAWLLSKGFTQAQFDASAFVVDVSDSGVDNGTTSPNHFGLYSSGIRPGTSRIVYNRIEGTPNLGSTLEGLDGHGTLNTHIVAGYNDLAGPLHADIPGYHYGLGVCPFVQTGSSVIFDPAWTAPVYPTLISQAYRDGARVSTNSWGSAVAGAYTIDSQAYDALVRDAQPFSSPIPTAGNQEMVILFAAGNSGPGATTTGAPGTGKNVITVGAADNVQPFGGKDGCGIADSSASSADDMASFSSKGPCADGRMKPDLVAPGTHITGGVIQVASPPAAGQVDPSFTGQYICGGPNFSFFFPAGQQWTVASSGTSHACPAVAGAAALLRQYFINGGLAPPSPAMTKAHLMNSARYLAGAGAGDNLWSPAQGFGEVNLGTALDGTPRVLLDERASDMFTSSGQSRTYSGVISDGTKPFRVTLAWTDAPGSTAGAAYDNDLDLTVTVGGSTYLGNVFSGASSVTGGTADRKNNVESVFLPAGASGPFTVTVTAYNINSDGVPNVGGPLDQDFALVVYNATPAPYFAPDSTSVLSEECSPPNGAVDPGEKVTLSFPLRNVGTADAVGVTAKLQASGGVIPVTLSSQNFGTLAAGGVPAAQPFTFIAQGTCGGTVTATLDLQAGTTSLGTISYSIPLGVAGVCCGGTGPKPVPDGLWVPGVPVTASKRAQDGSVIHLAWDVSCPAGSYNVYEGPLSAVSTGGYDTFNNCALTPSGNADVTLGPGNVFFLIVPVQGTQEGSHGRDSSALERPWTGVGHCGITSQDRTGTCP